MTPTATIPTTITTVETFFAAWNTGDLDTLETVADASIIVSDITGLLYTRAVYCGHAGLTEAVRELERRVLVGRETLSVEAHRLVRTDVVGLAVHG